MVAVMVGGTGAMVSVVPAAAVVVTGVAVFENGIVDELDFEVELVLDVEDMELEVLEVEDVLDIVELEVVELEVEELEVDELLVVLELELLEDVLEVDDVDAEELVVLEEELEDEDELEVELLVLVVDFVVLVEKVWKRVRVEVSKTAKCHTAHRSHRGRARGGCCRYLLAYTRLGRVRESVRARHCEV